MALPQNAPVALDAVPGAAIDQAKQLAATLHPAAFRLTRDYLRGACAERTLTGLAVGLVVCLNIESIRQFMSWLTNTELFSPELYFLSRLPAEMDAGETFAHQLPVAVVREVAVARVGHGNVCRIVGVVGVHARL